jgi:O-glycosyl hydrolase
MIRRTVLSGTAVIALIAAGMVAVSGPALAADTATINGATTYQTITGFGASEAFGEAGTVMRATTRASRLARRPSWASRAPGPAATPPPLPSP